MRTINVVLEDELADRKPEGVTWREVIALGIKEAEKKGKK